MSSPISGATVERLESRRLLAVAAPTLGSAAVTSNVSGYTLSVQRVPDADRYRVEWSSDGAAWSNSSVLNDPAYPATPSAVPNVTLEHDPSYENGAFHGGGRFYRVRAVSPAGEESPPSNVVWTTGSAVDRADQLSAEPDDTGVILRWPALDSPARYKVYRWSPTALSWGSPLTEVTLTQTYPRTHRFSFRDPTPAPAGGAEYMVESFRTGQTNPYRRGYALATRLAPVADDRGKVLIVSERLQNPDYAQRLAASIDTLRADLLGEGWGVAGVVSVDRDSDSTTSRPGVAELKALIRQYHTTYGSALKGVILVGHVPVPYSGYSSARDGHYAPGDAHRGAWVADSYYGDLDGAWTDGPVSTASFGLRDPENSNVQGDGKFDQDAIPSAMELFVGRIDFAKLPKAYAALHPQLAPRDAEAQLLIDYLDRNHRYRTGQFAVPMTAHVDSNFALPGAWLYRSLAPAIGGANVLSTDWRQAMSGAGGIWGFAGGSGNDDLVFGGDNTDGVLSGGAIKTVFNGFRASWMGDWDKQARSGTPGNNLMKAVLAKPGYGLVSIFANDAELHLHRMAAGASIGEALRDSLNGAEKYRTVQFDGVWGSWASLSILGDPTLGLHVVRPPTGVSAQTSPANPSDVAVRWQPSPEPGIDSYRVYRSAAPDGPFTYIGAAGPTATTFVDTNRTLPQRFYYMVRAVRLIETPSGSYHRASTGTIVESRAAREIASVFQPSTAQRVNVEFDRPVNLPTGLDPADVLLRRLGDNGFISPAPALAFADAGRRALMTFAGLPDGNYRLSIADDAVLINGERMVQPVSYDFHVLGGDANNDRRVDVADYAVLASNWGQAGRSYEAGNFDYDPAGLVGLGDLAIIANNYNRVLPAPAPATGAPQPGRPGPVPAPAQAASPAPEDSASANNPSAPVPLAWRQGRAFAAGLLIDAIRDDASTLL